jgi:hypothetical protein
MAEESAGQAVAATEIPGGGILVANRYVVLPEQRLSHLDRPEAAACQVEDRQNPNARLYALLSHPAVPIRADLLSGLMRRYCPNVVGPLCQATVAIDGGRERRFAVINEAPGGISLAQALTEREEPFSRAEVARAILPPVIDALEHLQERGLSHRSIHPGNIFFTGPEQSSIVLGECYSSPPARHLPDAYEPLETAAADPSARGEDTVAADLYNLGVSILALVTGEQPGVSMDAESLYNAKVSHGSYSALVGSKRLNPAIASLLMGLLADDPKRRWGFNTLRRWCDGFFDASNKPRTARRALRAYVFNGQEYFHPLLLAAAFRKFPAEARVELMTGRLEKWLRNTLSEKQSADTIIAALARIEADNAANEKVDTNLIARSSLALDPLGPLRYGELTLTISGVGSALAEALAENVRERLERLNSLLSGSLLAEWTASVAPEQSRFLPTYVCNALQSAMRERNRIGAGLERCLYMLNPGLACQSPKLRHLCVTTIPDLLRAMDWAAAKGEALTALFDRHVAAFMICRQQALEAPVMRAGRADLSTLDGKISLLQMLSSIQQSTDVGPLHGLTAAAATALQPSIDELHSKMRRDVMTARLKQLSEGGSLRDLVDGLELERGVRQDGQEYVVAVKHYQWLVRQVALIDRQGEARSALAAEQGYWIATMLAFCGLGVGVIATVARAML